MLWSSTNNIRYSTELLKFLNIFHVHKKGFSPQKYSRGCKAEFIKKMEEQTLDCYKKYNISQLID